MENIKDILPLFALAASLIGLYYKREELLSVKHKEFSNRLDSTIRFFKEFYESKDEKKIILDYAVQDIVKSNLIDFKLFCYLIKLDENYLIKLNDLIENYKIGHKFIDYIPTKNNININSFKLKTTKNRSFKQQDFYYTSQYFIFAFLGSMPFIFIQSLNFKDIKYITFVIIMSIASFSMAIISLKESSALSHANKFLTKIKEANEINNN